MDGTRSEVITVSAAGYADASAALDITDDDVPGFTVTETDGDTTVSETGSTDSFKCE